MRISGLKNPPRWSCHGPQRRDSPNSWTPVWNMSSTCNTSFALPDGAELVLTTATTFAGDCVACAPAATVSPSGVAEQAVALVNGRGADTAGRLSEHRAWWSAFWHEGATIDLGANQTTLESFYCKPIANTAESLVVLR